MRKISNRVIADLLRRYGSVLVLQGADRFKVQAYRRAADTVEALPEEVTTLLARGDDQHIINERVAVE